MSGTRNPQMHFLRISSLSALLVAVVLMLLPAISAAQSERGRPLRIGEVEAASFRVEYPAATGPTQIVRHPGASFIKLHFRTFDLLPGDYVSVSDPEGREVYTYPGSDYTLDESGAGEGFWPLSISGDTAVGTLHSSQGQQMQLEAAARDLGVEIDRFTRGFPEAQIDALLADPESTCGTNQRTDVVCFQATHPTEFGKSSAVARMVLNNGTGLCTGWRVGPNNHMFTNEHCITSQSQVNAAEAWFNYQRLACGGGALATTTKVAGNTFLTDDFTLDFALFTVTNFGSISGFGFLDLDVRTPLLDEEIYIPQHGAGNPKEFGIDSDVNDGGVCRIDDAVQNGRGTNTDTGYRCDTTGGSSGSPVLARSSHEVIALHHFGVGGASCPPATNGGVRIDLIWPKVEPFLTGGGPGCPTTIALESNLDRSGIQETLYRMRDDVLGRSENGRFYVRLFYFYSKEVSNLLLRDRNLAARTGSLLAAVEPQIDNLVEGGEAVLTVSQLREIESLMDAYAAKASFGLRWTIRWLRFGNAYRQVLAAFGFRIGAEG